MCIINKSEDSEMLYVERNKDGEVVGISKDEDNLHLEALVDDHPEVLNFMEKIAKSINIKQSLAVSDDEMVRVIDDLIGLLVEKQVFVFTELPSAVQAKLSVRNKMRLEINPLENLVGESDDLF